MTSPSSSSPPETALQLRSTVHADGRLELSLVPTPVGSPGPDDVVVRIEAAPINPSDLGLLFAAADMSTAEVAGEGAETVLTARIPKEGMAGLEGRVGQSLPVGNEGAGVVVAAGSSDAAHALVGRTVALFGGGTYTQYRCLPAGLCLPLPEGTTPEQGASCFVNPLTALGMVETMRLEGHTALVHTAAASNLGQMLNRLCIEDGVPLVNVVRRDEQVELLRGQGARFVCSSSLPSFEADLTDALAETGATLGFDATGGGTLAGQILACMEVASLRNASDYSRYGSTTHKQVYIYGGLDRSPTILERRFGMAWGLGGWLLPPFLQRVGPEVGQRLRERVAAGIQTTFASHYDRRVSLVGMLQREAIEIYGRQATGEKFLVDPSLA